MPAVFGPSTTGAFSLSNISPKFRASAETTIASVEESAVETEHGEDLNCRRSFLTGILCSGLLLSGLPSIAGAAEEESFASIALRAVQLSSETGENTAPVAPNSDDPRTAYDFSLPVAGETIQFQEIVHQQYDSDGRGKVKAILVVNMKEDDPVARKDIPELMSLASK